MASRNPSTSHNSPGQTRTDASDSLPAAEILSFLQEVGTSSTWTERDLAKSLQIGAAEAKSALSVLQLQGYAEPVGASGKWRTTDAGALVSGVKPARCTRASIDRALETLAQRIHVVNHDPNSPFIVDEAVAFGDILSDKARLQPANVGIRLTRRKEEPAIAAAKHVGSFLRELRGKSALLHVVPFEPWMNHRTHRKLL